MNTIDDLMGVFGIKKGVEYTKWKQIEVEATNDWLEGVDADYNPYKAGTLEHSVWYQAWLNCNKNA
jgi:hypothetical protein